MTSKLEGATVAQRIQAVMRERGWVNPQGEPNVKEMERRTGLSYGALNNLIRGRTERPEMRTVEKVAEGLRVPVDALLGRGDFDLRAYEMGKQVVADAVRESLDRVADLPPPTPEPEDDDAQRSRKNRRRRRARDRNDGGEGGQDAAAGGGG